MVIFQFWGKNLNNTKTTLTYTLWNFCNFPLISFNQPKSQSCHSMAINKLQSPLTIPNKGQGYPTSGIRGFLPKSWSQIKIIQPQKIHLFKSLRTITSLQLYLRHSILQYLCYFFSATNQNCFHVILQPVFTFNFKLEYSARLIHHYIFWCVLNIFRLEAINPRNTLACFKDSLNLNMKIFPGGFAPIPYTLSCLSIFSLQKKWCVQTKPWTGNCL